MDLREATIRHFSKHSAAQLLDKFSDGSLQIELHRVFCYELGNLRTPPIYRVYFPTFHLAFSASVPAFSNDEKKDFLTEER